MRIVIDNKIYDSLEKPILIVFEESEQELFNGMKRFVSAPPNSTEEERQSLIEFDIDK